MCTYHYTRRFQQSQVSLTGQCPFPDTTAGEGWETVSYHFPNVGLIVHLFRTHFLFIEYLQLLSAICCVE